MDNSSESIFQSGERVYVTGQYEMVPGTGQLGAPRVYCEVKANEVFPYHNGMEVCWHLTAAIPHVEIILTVESG